MKYWEKVGLGITLQVIALAVIHMADFQGVTNSLLSGILIVGFILFTIGHMWGRKQP